MSRHEWEFMGYRYAADDESGPPGSLTAGGHLFYRDERGMWRRFPSNERALSSEILRLAARVRELEAPVAELLAKLRACREPSFEPVATEALALIGTKQAALEEENRRLRAAMPTADELTALKQSLEGWRNIQETCGKGHYFADGWGGRQLAALLEKLTPPGSAA